MTPTFHDSVFKRTIILLNFVWDTVLGTSPRNGAILGFDVRKQEVQDLLKTFADLAAIRDCLAPPGSDRSNHRQDQALAKLEKGKMTTAPVQTEYGWHIIELEDLRAPSAPAFEDVQEQVKMFAQRKKLQAYLENKNAENFALESALAAAKKQVCHHATPAPQACPTPHYTWAIPACDLLPSAACRYCLQEWLVEGPLCAALLQPLLMFCSHQCVDSVLNLQWSIACTRLTPG
jgi:hypothetical protein